MKDKWYLPIILFAVLVVSYIVRGFFDTRITLELLQTDKIEQYRACKGVLLKDEQVYHLSLGGTTEIIARSEERVATGEPIATVYGGETDEATQIAFADVNKRIAAMEESHSGDAVFINDATKIESEIAAGVDEVIQKVALHDMQSLSEYKYRFLTLADQKAVAKGEKQGFSNDIVQLRAEKSRLEAKLGKIETVAMAEYPGIFIEGSDGFETELPMNKATEMTPETVTDIIKREANGDVQATQKGTYAYRIVKNYTYRVAMNVDKDFLGEMEQGDSIQLRFSDLSTAVIPGTLIHISEVDKKNQVTVVAECDRYIEGILSKRVVNVDFITKSISGYKIKVEYLHTADHRVGVYVKRGAVMKFIPVNVIYSTEEEAIIEAESDAKPIKHYDEIVTDAPVFEDGRVIVSQ